MTLFALSYCDFVHCSLSNAYIKPKRALSVPVFWWICSSFHLFYYILYFLVAVLMKAVDVDSGTPNKLLKLRHWISHVSSIKFRDNTRHTTLCRSLLGEWSARHRELYLTTHNIHKRTTSMLPSGFEPPISGSDKPQTHTFNHAITGTNPKSEIIVVKWPAYEG
jgi:hypothetical protein